jgi:hypothetical protein
MVEGVDEAIVDYNVGALGIGASDSIFSDCIFNNGAIDGTDCVHDERAWCLAGKESCRDP